MKLKILLLLTSLSFLPCFSHERINHQGKYFKTPYRHSRVKYFKSPYKKFGSSVEKLKTKKLLREREVKKMSTTPIEIIASDNKKIRAFLDLISFAEGNTTYKTHYGFKNKLFNPKKEFPCQRITLDGIRSSACGMYQIMDFTYWRLKKKLGIKGFSPKNQDLIAIELIKEAGAYNDILRGDIKRAIIKCSWIWASFDNGHGKSRYGQGVRKMKTLLKVYDKLLKIKG